MSAIASFYVVPGQRLSEIVAAATPVRGRWWRPARDNFRPVLRAASRELQSFGWSGWEFNTLDLYLEARHGFMYGKFGDAALSGELSKARGAYWLVLPAAGASQLLAALDAVEADASDVTAFVVAEHGPDGAAEEAEAVLAALATLQSWLCEITSGTIGLHSVG